MILDYKVKEQTICEVPRESVARRGSRKYLRLRFQFDDEWQELTKTLYLQHETFSEPIIVEDGKAVHVPDYFTTQEYFMITLVGINGDQAVPTNIITISLDPSGEAWETSPPDTDFPAYQQLVQLAQQAVETAITYTPQVSAAGVLSWTNDKNKPNPAPVSLKGPKGEKGDPGTKGAAGQRGAQIIPALADDMPEYGDTEVISAFDLPEGCNVAAGDTIIGLNGRLATVTQVTDSGSVFVLGTGVIIKGAQIIPAFYDDMPEAGETDGIAPDSLPEVCAVAVGDTIIGRNGLLATVTGINEYGIILVRGIGTNLTGAPGIGLPAVTAADNGKIPVVVNGQWAIEQPINAAEVAV